MERSLGPRLRLAAAPICVVILSVLLSACWLTKTRVIAADEGERIAGLADGAYGKHSEGIPAKRALQIRWNAAQRAYSTELLSVRLETAVAVLGGS